jgi:hypothetical protein
LKADLKHKAELLAGLEDAKIMLTEHIRRPFTSSSSLLYIRAVTSGSVLIDFDDKKIVEWHI